MSRRLKNQKTTVMEEQAYATVQGHFAGHLREFQDLRQATSRLERDLAQIILAASKPKRRAVYLETDGNEQWQKHTELMNNIFLCYRSSEKGTEYAVVEYFVPRGTNSIRQRGQDVAVLLKTFIHEQREIMQVWVAELHLQAAEFLAGHFHGQDTERVVDRFVLQFIGAGLPQPEATSPVNPLSMAA